MSDIKITKEQVVEMLKQNFQPPLSKENVAEITERLFSMEEAVIREAEEAEKETEEPAKKGTKKAGAETKLAS